MTLILTESGLATPSEGWIPYKRALSPGDLSPRGSYYCPLDDLPIEKVGDDPPGSIRLYASIFGAGLEKEPWMIEVWTVEDSLVRFSTQEEMHKAINDLLPEGVVMQMTCLYVSNRPTGEDHPRRMIWSQIGEERSPIIRPT